MNKIEKSPIDQAWQNWIVCLKGEDKNSIFNQITLMLWDAAIFRIILESQKDKYEKNSQEPRINQQFSSFIRRNFIHTQCVFIRRLSETGYKLTGKKSTYSLGAIINDLKNYREELNREKYLELRDLKYDYSEIQRKQIAFVLQNHPDESIPIPQELDWWKARDAQETFDKLSQTNIENREPTDLIDGNLLERLKNKLDDCRKINSYVNKFIAHAATIESRSIINFDELNLTLNNIWEAHEIIYKVANFLSAVLFSIDNMPLAFEHPSFYAYWDEPFFKENAFDKVRMTLEGYREETENWMESSIKDVWSWIEK